MRTLAATVLGILAVALAPVPAASAQMHNCGDIQLVFRNPDLQPGADELIRASGQFFAQFQAIGEGADEIEVFGFSFGPDTMDFDEEACDRPVWFTGPYVINYRADRNPDDGFFIPLKTSLVPDGQYAAAVHAYDAGGEELARFWARAIVDNCDAAGPVPPARCDGDQAQNTRQDTTAPWPMVLPGDGQPLEGHTFTVEFGEPISWYSVHLNGDNITGNMTEWEGRIWDADYMPDYGPAGTGEAVAPPCSGTPGQTCIKYGPAYEWTERALTNDDFVRIEAADLAGNVAIKSIHIGSSVAGGAITEDIPILSHTVAATELTVAPTETAVFQFTIENYGGGTGHPAAAATGPPGWDIEWQPPHVPVDSGQTVTQELLVTPPAGATTGTYEVQATLTYAAGGEEKVLAQALTVLVNGNAPQSDDNGTDEGGGGSKGSPAPAMPVALALFVAAAVVLRRRS
jgi:hypothetical protein